MQIEKAAAAGQYPLTTSGFYVELGFTLQKGGDIDSSGLTLIPITPDPFVWTATVESIKEKLSRCRQTLEKIQPGSTLPPSGKKEQ